ncbi:MAG: hypothetical protein ACI363_08435 [Phocaeicola plebeius]
MLSFFRGVSSIKCSLCS